MNQERLVSNLTEVNQRIADAAARASRQAGEITLVAVTKYVAIDEVLGAIAAGCRSLGESRPQQLWSKAKHVDESLPDAKIEWHMIGHLQRNKVEKSLDFSSLIHSVDSLRLMQAINNAALKRDRAANLLLEVNVSGDQSKHGWHPAEIGEALAAAEQLTHVNVHGLMTMAALGGGPDVSRQNFRELRSIFEKLKPAAGPDFKHLSMGMSGDYEIAIEEGATLVRVGSALWEGVTA